MDDRNKQNDAVSRQGDANKKENKENTGNAGRQPKPSVPIYRKKRIWIPVFLLVLIAAAVYRYWDTNLRGYVSTDDAQIAGHSLAVSAKTLGRIIQLAVEEGDTVQPGQFLVQLDTTDLDAQKSQALANLNYAEKNSILAKANLNEAQEDYNRAALQYKNKVIPQAQYDHSRQALEKARAQYDIALAQIKTAQSQVHVLQTQIQNGRIFSPMAGRVAKKWALVGNVVQPSQPIYTIFDLKNIWVEAYFSETKIKSIRLGDKVDISVDAYPGREFEGKVYLIGSAAASQFSLIPPNNASGNFTKVAQRVPFRISINNPASDSPSDPIHLLPGMSVTVKINARNHSNAR